MAINVGELQEVLQELSELTAKPTWSKTDERRNAFLLAAASGIKQGVSLQAINRDRLNDVERSSGLTVTRFTESAETLEYRDARIWQRFCLTGELEKRDEGVGNGNSSSGKGYLQGSVGSLVARDFLAGVRATAKAYDRLLDDSVISYVETVQGRPMQAPFMSDVESVAATVTAENSDQSGNELDIASVGSVDIGAYSYRTPMWRVSVEALQDLDQIATVVELFKVFSASRIARGVGRDLMSGTGVGKPLGLLTSLQAVSADAQGAVATGDSEVTGGGQTGVNSIGNSDLAMLYFSVDEAYRQQPKCAWLMNDGTRQFLSSVLDKNGSPVMRWRNDREFLFGKPVYTSPSMPSIASHSIPIIFGDLGAWVTRHATAGDRVQLFTQSPGLAEKGEVGLRTYSRYDGALMFDSTSANSTCPIKYLIMHSFHRWTADSVTVEQLKEDVYAFNEEHCEPPLDEAELDRTVIPSVQKHKQRKDETITFGGIPAGTATAPSQTIPELDTTALADRPVFPYWVIQGTTIGEGFVKPVLATSSKHAEFLFLPAVQLMLNCMFNKVRFQYQTVNLNMFLGLVSPPGKFFKSTSSELAHEYFKCAELASTYTPAMKNKESHN